MLVKDSWGYITSHRDTHFTDSLIGYASEYEDIVVPGAGASGPFKCYITSVVLITATNHAWNVTFHSSDTRRLLAASPYSGLGGQKQNLLDWVEFAAADAENVATEWWYAMTNLKIPYLDEDNTGELHVGLHNRSTTTKGALGATLPSGVNPQYVTLRVGFIAAA